MSDHLPAVPAPPVVDGLEDIDSSDITTPILRLDHETANYVLSLTNEEFKTLNVIMLGLVKQRILWPAEPGEKGQQPLCRSYDHKLGQPNGEEFYLTVRREGKITLPWSLDQIEAGDLACETCPLKEWETHPKGKSPWCNEQYTVPLLICREDGARVPALISFSRTGVKPIRSYMSGFQAAREPLYTSYTTMSGQLARKGTAEYAVPRFVKGDPTDPSEWPEFSKFYNGIRRMITVPRRRDDDSDEAEVAVDEPTTPAAAAAAPPPSTTTAGAAPVDEPMPAAARRAAPAAASFDDEEPF